MYCMSHATRHTAGPAGHPGVCDTGRADPCVQRPPPARSPVSARRHNVSQLMINVGVRSTAQSVVYRQSSVIAKSYISMHNNSVVT
ncbi:hypothetical protein JYU34_013196 [Plutella xylostella]|uniref:Uncharacterized protein n=1 Tax=Plutella xylostella TaxID=51655 RepID=A0ABQ7QD63_PLUXY|nr:hypothetical protein JYU34_013196 [Plutella xylostella]